MEKSIYNRTANTTSLPIHNTQENNQRALKGR